MRKTIKTSLRILALLAAVFLLLLLGYTAFTLSRTREAAHTLDEYQALYTDIQILQGCDFEKAHIISTYKRNKHLLAILKTTNQKGI